MTLILYLANVLFTLSVITLNDERNVVGVILYILSFVFLAIAVAKEHRK